VSQIKGKKIGTRLTLDTIEQTDQTIALVDDHQEHWIKVRMDVKDAS